MLTRFVSPLSETLGPAFYKYYLGDTLMLDGEKCLKLVVRTVQFRIGGFCRESFMLRSTPLILSRNSIWQFPKISI